MKPPDDFLPSSTVFFPLFLYLSLSSDFFGAAPAESWLPASHAALLLGEWRANQCVLTKGEEHSESQLFPEAMGNEEVGETEGDSAERERGEGVDNMFPLLLYTERNNMITAALTCSKYSADNSSQPCTNAAIHNNRASGTYYSH